MNAYDEALKESLRDSLGSDHPGYEPSTYQLEREEFEESTDNTKE